MKDLRTTRDDFVGHVAERLRDRLNALVKKANLRPRTLQVGDVAMLSELTQFHVDGNVDHCDVGVIHLNLTFFTEGSLVLILKLPVKEQTAHVLCLSSGRTGWIDKGAMARHR